MDNTPRPELYSDTQHSPHAAEQVSIGDSAPGVIVDEQGHPYGKTEDPSHKKSDTEREILDRVKTGERWMIFLTAIVAGSAVFQTVQSCHSSASTSQQVDKIIVAANGVNGAAGSFSQSAAAINTGVSDAVAKFNLQADALNKSAEQTRKLVSATEASNANSLSSDRPWVTISLADDRKISGMSQPSFVNVYFSNTGKRPALVIKSNFDEGGLRIKNDPIMAKNILPTFKAHYRESDTADTFIVPPGGTITKQFLHLGGTPDNVYTGGKFRFYRWAIVDYVDPTTKIPYSTTFCDFWVPDSPLDAKWAGCPTYNEAK